MNASHLGSKRCVGGVALPARSARSVSHRERRAGAVAVRAAAAGGFVPDMPRRNVMNLLLLGAVGLPATTMLGAYAFFFVPKGSGGGGAGISAKDALGNDVKASAWIKLQGKGGRALTQGLKGDPTYLVVTEDEKIESYGINAICTHLGCVVPWNVAEKKFKCPCHGSQYDRTGKVVRGPAPLSLALAHCEVSDDDGVLFSPWTETDFRTGLDPWWK